MEVDLGPEIAQFRAELREWIAAEAPEELAGLADWNMHVATRRQPQRHPRRRRLITPPTASGSASSWPRG